MRTYSLLASLLLLASTAGPSFGAATVILVNQDDPGEGLGDPGFFASEGGNPATTIGEARRFAVEFAVMVWAEQLDSEVPIRIGVSFDSLGGASSAAVLGRGGGGSVFRDFVGAPRPGTWYSSAVADRLAGEDLAPGELDIELVFNVDVDGSTVLGGTRFYYGLDAAPAAEDIDFVSVALHEMGHALGFNTQVDPATGAKLLGYDDAFMVHLEHHGAVPSDFPSMTDAQRVAALTAEPSLHWVGVHGVTAGGVLQAGFGADGHVEIDAPVDGSRAGGRHFAVTLSPDEFMEPFYETAEVNFALTLGVLRDIGWGAAPSCDLGVRP